MYRTWKRTWVYSLFGLCPIPTHVYQYFDALCRLRSMNEWRFAEWFSMISLQLFSIPPPLSATARPLLKAIFQICPTVSTMCDTRNSIDKPCISNIHYARYGAAEVSKTIRKVGGDTEAAAGMYWMCRHKCDGAGCNANRKKMESHTVEIGGSGHAKHEIVRSNKVAGES